MGRAEMDPSTNPFADELDDEAQDPREPGEDFDNEDEDDDLWEDEEDDMWDDDDDYDDDEDF